MSEKSRDKEAAKKASEQERQRHKIGKFSRSNLPRLKMANIIFSGVFSLLCLFGYIFALHTPHKYLALWIFCSAACVVCIWTCWGIQNSWIAHANDLADKPSPSTTPPVVESPQRKPFSEERDSSRPFSITAGGNVCEILETGTPFSVVSLRKRPNGNLDMCLGSTRVTEDTMVTAKVVNGNLYIDADLYSGPQSKPMLLRDNVLENRPAGWDLNMKSGRALEVVNEAGIPVFQIVYADDFTVTLNGIFINSNGIVIASPDGLSSTSLGGNIPYDVKPLFKYPSFKHLGEFSE